MIQAERTGPKQERRIMCKEDDNKAIVGRWFKDFWNTPPDLTVVDELVTPDVLLQYSPNTPWRGRDAVRAFRTAAAAEGLSAAFLTFFDKTSGIQIERAEHCLIAVCRAERGRISHVRPDGSQR
jgi:hypothetical protein